MLMLLRDVPKSPWPTPSPVSRRSLGGSSQRAPKRLRLWELASLQGVSATGRRPVLRCTPTCCDS
eukprot:14389607-Alexandrium_andersonii.AAC.1